MLNRQMSEHQCWRERPTRVICCCQEQSWTADHILSESVHGLSCNWVGSKTQFAAVVCLRRLQLLKERS